MTLKNNSHFTKIDMFDMQIIKNFNSSLESKHSCSSSQTHLFLAVAMPDS